MRLKLALFINAPPGLETLVYIVKQILPEKLQKRIFVYSGYKSIYNHIPRELLPKDYGGDDLSLEEMTGKLLPLNIYKMAEENLTPTTYRCGEIVLAHITSLFT